MDIFAIGQYIQLFYDVINKIFIKIDKFVDKQEKMLYNLFIANFIHRRNKK